MALFRRANLTRNAIGFTENFPAYLNHIARQNDKLHAEITSSDRYKHAMAMSQRVEGK